MDLSRLSLLLLAVLLSACAGKPPINPAPAAPAVMPGQPPVQNSSTSKIGLAVIDTARNMLGSPYRYGGINPRGFDCSGLVSYAYRQAGIQVPRTSAEQYRYAQKVALDKLQPGDLLFFRLSPPKVSHVGIYDRNGRFIHAPASGQSVSYAHLDTPYWRKHLIGAGRFR